VADITFLDEAIEDLEALDGGAQRLVLGKMRLLADNPEAGQPLGRTQTGNLTGFRKLVVGNRDHRIVYRVEDDGSVCVVWVIGPRDDDRCYEMALDRLRDLGNDPRARRLADALAEMKPRTRRQVVRIRPDLVE
jgi:mRNA interferase RelE/StbE